MSFFAFNQGYFSPFSSQSLESLEKGQRFAGSINLRLMYNTILQYRPYQPNNRNLAVWERVLFTLVKMKF